MIALTSNQITLLTHTLGLDSKCRKPYRNYFEAGQNDPELDGMVDAGIMIRQASRISVGMIYHCTDIGEKFLIDIGLMGKPS